jgi:putative cell wall-binding protein
MEEILSKSTKGLRKAGVASIAASLTLGAGAFGAGAANAVEGFSFDRIPGENRYDTSALIADDYNATNVHAILAPGEHGKYADALSANLLAGSTDSPILLTRKEFTPKPVLQQLRDQGTQRITVVGGAGVISEEQVAALRSEGYTVNRVSGPDRFDTNARVIGAADVQAVNGVGLIATGFDFADALAGGPVSYQGHPLGLSTKDDIEQDVIDALKAAGVERVFILGGEAAVSSAVAAKLTANGIEVAGRLAGANRAATSVEIAEHAVANWGFTNEHVGVASGYVEGSGADALAGGPLEGQGMAPMLVTRNERNPGEVLDYLRDHSNTLVDGHLFGGIVAITAEAERQMTEAAQGDAPATNQTFTVTPAGNQQDETGGEDVDFTVSGITSSTVDVALVPCENVNVDQNGVATFTDDAENNGAGNDQADLGSTPATITAVNGGNPDTDTGETAQYQNNVNVVNESVTFSVNSNEADCVVAVVFDDANGNNQLDLDANNQPTEAFAVTGETEFVPPAAANQTMNENVVSNNEANNQFTGCEITTGTAGGAGTEEASTTECFVFSYDSNDRFFAGEATLANQLTMAEFEERLTSGDDIGGTYLANSELTSEFILFDESPTAPTVAAAQTEGAEDTSVTLTLTETSDADSFQVFRAADACTNVDFGTQGNFTQIGNVDNTAQSPETFVASGLNPSTTYCFVATATDEGQQSGASDETEQATAPTPAAPNTINSANLTTDTVVEGAPDTNDVWTLVFSKDATNVADDGLFRLQDTTGDVYQVQCGATTDASGNPVAGVTDDANTASALCELGDATGSAAGSNDQVTLTLVETPTDRNAAGDGVLTYPSQIINVANANVDLAASSDVTIG